MAKYFHLRGVRVLPRPVSQPHPEILWGAAAPKAVQRAAQLDLGFASVSGKREIMLYLDALKQLGKDPSRYSVVSSRIIHIASSEEEAWREASPAMMYQAELYAKWLAAGYGTDPSKTFIRPDPERLKRTGLLGPVDFVRRRVEQILDVHCDHGVHRGVPIAGDGPGQGVSLARTFRKGDTAGDKTGNLTTLCGSAKKFVDNEYSDPR